LSENPAHIIGTKVLIKGLTVNLKTEHDLSNEWPRPLNLINEYTELLHAIKDKVRNAQLKAVVAVNQELLRFYWELGGIIIEKQAKTTWGDGLINQLSSDLKKEFPDMKGFSISNLKYIKQWFQFYSQNSVISQQAVGQITQIPWGHNIAIISKCKSLTEAIYYVHNTMQHNWSRSVLVHQIESGLYNREGKSINNFAENLPMPQSDLAVQTLKDPYVFDFLSMTKEYTERDLERELTNHISHFLLELGSGFAYVGKQVNIRVGDRDFYIDLLFYHITLHCYVVVELKNTEFEPEHAGKLNFYIKAVDQQLKKDIDNPTIGLLICKSKNKIIAEYALSDINKPIGISEYQLVTSLPENLKPSLPSIEDIEYELLDHKKS
jgi:predicted nuclease of restriction endonuclease-like (RecB) superfamily